MNKDLNIIDKIISFLTIFGLGIITGGIINYQISPDWEDKKNKIIIYNNIKYRLVPVENKWHDKNEEKE